MKTVLAPIDFSDISRSVINEAVALARATNARLVLLNVVQLPAIIGTGYESEDIAPGFHLETEYQSKRRLTDLQWKLRDEGVTAHVIHQVGSPGERILQQAERLDAELSRSNAVGCAHCGDLHMWGEGDCWQEIEQ